MKQSKHTLLIFVLFVLGLSTTVAQEPVRQFKIGFASFFSPATFIEEMTALGYVDGENITYMVPSFENVAPEKFMESYLQQLTAMAEAQVDVLVTNTDTDAMNLKAIAGDTPIVFSRSDDPIATGAVADLINPGGQMTGVVTNRPHERRLQILTEVNPATDKVYYLYSPLTLEAETVLAQVQVVAEELNIEVIPAPLVDSAAGIEALKNIPDGIDWLFLTPFVPFDQQFFEALAEVSTTSKAGISWVTNDPAPMYLVSYGPSIVETDRQVAHIVDRILRGASPAELPVETAENYLTINLEIAETIGLDVPVGILRQADLIVRPGYFENLTVPSN